MPNYKTCTKCLVSKELRDFKKDNRRKDGYSSHCRTCCQIKNLEWRKNHPDKFNAIAKTWRSKNKDLCKSSTRRNALKSFYGLTVEQYNNMLIQQNHVCAVCLKPETSCNKAGTVKQLAVDHCHKTNKIRGLLCDACNRAEGYLKSDPTVIRRLADYVEKNSLIK